MAAALGLATTASAAPQNGPSGEAFYTPPNVSAVGTPGELLRYTKVDANLGFGSPGTNAYRIMYRSTDSKDNPNIVTGTVLVPKTSFSGTRPVVAYAFGTQGLAPKCAPSRQITANTEYEAPNLIEIVKRNYTVVASDYAGYTTGGKATYIAGASQGHAVLDARKAAAQIPSGGVAAAAKTAIWGFSQGGQSAAFAGEQASTYAPNINLSGVVFGGAPGNLDTTARYLNKSAGASFLLQALVGLSTEYPEEVSFDNLSNAAGKAARTDAQTNLCVFAALNKYINKDVSEYLSGGLNLNTLLARPDVQSVIAKQKLGTKAIPVPVYDFHGQADEFIPLEQAYQLKKDYCAKGTKVTFDLYPSEHLTTLFQAAPKALQFIDDRFAGKAAGSTCNNGLPDPTSTAETPGGDFIVNLDKWNLSGTATLATLRQNLTLPEGGIFDGFANLTAGKLQGNIDVPAFKTTIDIAGIKVLTAIKLNPTGPITGTVKLDDNGQLHLAGNAPVSVQINSLSVGPINLGTNCRTDRTMHIPIKFDGPVSALGTGKLTSDTRATFPSLGNCGLYGPILSALIASSGNRFVLTESPPAPRSY